MTQTKTTVAPAATKPAAPTTTKQPEKTTAATPSPAETAQAAANVAAATNSLQDPVPGAAPKPPINQRLEKFQMLEKYVTQLELVEESLEELADFTPDPNGGDQVIIRRANGKTHNTNHPVAIEAMMAAAVSKLQARKAELEDCIVL